MTITIHRPVWRPRLAIAVGLATILVVAAFAILQSTDTEAADTAAPVASAPVVSSASHRQMLRLQSLQDNYLPPTVTSAAAWLRLQSLQDNYLAPTVTSAAAWLRLQSLQDNYLSPTATAAPAESQTFANSADRTNQPR